MTHRHAAMLIALSTTMLGGCLQGSPSTETEPAEQVAIDTSHITVTVHDHEHDAFAMAYRATRTRVAPESDAAVLLPGHPARLSKEQLEHMKRSGNLDGVDLAQLSVVQSENGFVILVRGGTSFLTHTLVVPTALVTRHDLRAEAALSVSAQHNATTQTDAIGTVTGIEDMTTWLAGGAS